MYTPLDIIQDPSQPFTDYSRWRLLVTDGGRHTWHYLATDEECNAWPQNTVDKFWLGLDLNLPALPHAQTPLEAARNGYTFYKNLQSHDGHWPGEYSGPMFILPGLVIGSYVSGMTFTTQETLEMVRYVMNRARPEDGGWGSHVEGPTTVLGTALNYAAIRILGVDAEHPVCVKARATLHKLGGACGIPALGKVWLSLLNVYDWDGNNPILPEFWLLPEWLPFHPHRWPAHTRAVYSAMSYLYAVKFQMKENDLILALRQELYPQDYSSIYWPAQRNNVCQADIYIPPSPLFNMLSIVLSTYERNTLPSLRGAAEERAYELVVMEDENTGYQTIGSVSKMFNLVARAHREGRESEAYKKHEIKRQDFMWMGKDGMMMAATDGTQLWDVAFISQGLVETGLGTLEENKESILNALKWLDDAQIRENPQHYHAIYRHATKGAWSFSTKEQGYTVSDSVGEGLKAVIHLQNHLDYTPSLVSEPRLRDTVDLLLTLQNPSGGYAAYELIRIPPWLQRFTPDAVLANVMLEASFPECTTSAITSLAIFREHYPHYRANDIEKTIQSGITYIHNSQRPEGVWYGSWGICFTYATQFALESLSLVGETYETSKYPRRACDFLVGKQRADGGWGESWESCEQMKWIDAESQIVQTCWAVMSLMHAKYPHPEPIERGVRLVMSRQLSDGSWPQEAISGVGNKTCTVNYSNFKFSFPIWMLGKAHVYLTELRGHPLSVQQ